MSGSRGYILVEAVTAMAVLSIAAVTVQQAVHTAVLARGLSQDFTVAQCLLERIASDCAMQPRIAVGEEHAGTFESPQERFSYRWLMNQIQLPTPELPSDLNTEQRAALTSNLVGHMGKLHIEIHWSRGGEPFSVSAETLVGPDRIWVAPGESAP